MSLRPTAIALDSTGGMYVVIDDPESSGPLLIPCSFDHRRIDISRDELSDWEIHSAVPLSEDSGQETPQDAARRIREETERSLDGQFSPTGRKAVEGALTDLVKEFRNRSDLTASDDGGGGKSNSQVPKKGV